MTVLRVSYWVDSSLVHLAAQWHSRPYHETHCGIQIKSPWTGTWTEPPWAFVTCLVCAATRFK